MILKELVRFNGWDKNIVVVIEINDFRKLIRKWEVLSIYLNSVVCSKKILYGEVPRHLYLSYLIPFSISRTSSTVSPQPWAICSRVRTFIKSRFLAVSRAFSFLPSSRRFLSYSSWSNSVRVMFSISIFCRSKSPSRGYSFMDRLFFIKTFVSILLNSLFNLQNFFHGEPAALSNLFRSKDFHHKKVSGSFPWIVPLVKDT